MKYHAFTKRNSIYFIIISLWLGGFYQVRATTQRARGSSNESYSYTFCIDKNALSTKGKEAFYVREDRNRITEKGTHFEWKTPIIFKSYALFFMLSYYLTSPGDKNTLDLAFKDERGSDIDITSEFPRQIDGNILCRAQKKEDIIAENVTITIPIRYGRGNKILTVQCYQSTTVKELLLQIYWKHYTITHMTYQETYDAAPAFLKDRFLGPNREDIVPRLTEGKIIFFDKSDEKLCNNELLNTKIKDLDFFNPTYMDFTFQFNNISYHVRKLTWYTYFFGSKKRSCYTILGGIVMITVAIFLLKKYRQAKQSLSSSSNDVDEESPSEEN